MDHHPHVQHSGHQLIVHLGNHIHVHLIHRLNCRQTTLRKCLYCHQSIHINGFHLQHHQPTQTQTTNEHVGEHGLRDCEDEDIDQYV